MNIKDTEKKLKSFLKSKVRITMALMVGFMISGNLFANDIVFRGGVNVHGDPDGMVIPTGDNINGVDISLFGNSNHKTTLALKLEKNYTVTGDIKIVNTIIGSENNDGLFAKNGAKLTVGDENSNIFIASIAQDEKNLGTLQNASSVLAAKLGGGNNNIEVKGKVVQLIGNIDFKGNNNGKNNKIKVTLNSKDSFWYGDESNQENLHLGNFINMDKGELDLTLENGAEWIYNKESTISSITLNKNGIVNLQDDDIKEKYKNTIIENGGEKFVLEDYRSEKPHQKVTIENLKGNGGIFKIDLDWESNQGKKKETEKSDYIYITKVDDSAKDSIQTISFDSSKANLNKMKVGDKLYFANVKEGETKFTTIYGDSWSDTRPENVFDYNNFVGQEGKDWYIGVSGKEIGKNGNFVMAKGSMYATYFLGTEMDSLSKRMGELNYLEDNEGMWVRHRYAKTKWDDTFEIKSNMVQFGYTTPTKDNHKLGISFDYTEADTTIYNTIGEGENKRYSISLYDTWKNENNSYYDLVLRGGRIDNKYDTKGIFTNGLYDIESNYHKEFCSISGEYGHKYEIENGWYFKPQTQLQMAYIGGEDYTTNSGIKVEEDGITSFIGRLGFDIGRKVGKNNYYIKANLLHEFMGDKEFALTGSDGYLDKEFDGKETWVNLGIGTKIDISENTSLWFDVERSLRGEFENTWQTNLGFSYKF